MPSISCRHNHDAPEDVIKALPHSQGGSGRHKCAVCAYALGLQDGLNNVAVTQGEACEHSSVAPTPTLERLPDSQAGWGLQRHKCTNCAYELGYKEGQSQSGAVQISLSLDSIETELDTHGIENPNEPETEGKRKLRIHVTYERSTRNREEALRIHGTICKACGFDFNAIYGDFARHYIEVHHVESLSSMGERVVTPATDLVPLCSNCHSMAHREKGRILTVAEIQDLMDAAKTQQTPLKEIFVLTPPSKWKEKTR